MGLLRIIIRALLPSRPKHYNAPRARPQRNGPKLSKPNSGIIRGRCWVVDGDTIVIDKVHIRLAGIDAPELDHPWGRKSKWALLELCKGQTVTAHIRPELSYDRVVAECFLPDGRDLAAEQVRQGLALDWQKFSGGKYRHLEPRDARKRLWLADARQKGRQVFSQYSEGRAAPRNPSL